MEQIFTNYRESMGDMITEELEASIGNFTLYLVVKKTLKDIKNEKQKQ